MRVEDEVRMLFLLLLPFAVALSTYHNPIIPGFAPDPSCTRVNERFFCVTSSFSAFPGVPVYTSTDLVQWEQIGNVFSRQSQLPAFTQVNSTTGGIWAATIRYHLGTYYVTTTLVEDNKAVDDSTRWDNVRLYLSPRLPRFALTSPARLA